MYDYSKKLQAIMFGKLKSVHLGELQIDTPEGLPVEVETRLDKFNEAISRFDMEEAEAAADEILEWIDFETSGRIERSTGLFNTSCD